MCYNSIAMMSGQNTQLPAGKGQAHLPQSIQSTRSKIFLAGPPGSGKTTLAVERLRWLIRRGMPTTSILVLTPQRTLATPYYDALRDPDLGPAGTVDVITLDGLARRVIQLFWPLIGDRAGFAHPTHAPVFLTVETAQYFMDGVVGPLIDQHGYFDAVTIGRTRLLSQLLDNLNKAALVGIPLGEVPERLKGAWIGESARSQIYDQAGECVGRFRRYCLDHNLLDFSLQIETFLRHLWPQAAVRAYLFERYRHLILDNVEEDTPVVHDLLAEWVPQCDSAFIAFDRDGGYRIFLGADPASAARLAAACDERVELAQSHVASPNVLHLGYQVGLSLRQSPGPVTGDFRQILHFQVHRFHPQMLDWAADEIAQLVAEGTPPGEIVVLAPFISDALRFSLLEKLAARDIPARSHRPSRALRDEPAARCLLTLAKLAHPAWELSPPPFDVTLALTQAIAGLDLVRARLLTDVVYRPQSPAPPGPRGEVPQTGYVAGAGSPQPLDLDLSAFTQIQDEMRGRIGYLSGERYDTLRSWLEHYQEGADGVPDEEVPFDYFLSRLFGEVLSQPGFGFHGRNQGIGEAGKQGSREAGEQGVGGAGRQSASLALEAGRVASDLIESARKFREALELVPGTPGEEGVSIGARFVRMVERGVVAATYVQSWRLTQGDAVLIAPAYTYLMTNRPVDFQFWLDAGSNGWWERIYQPLTHPYVLRRDWEPGDPWTDEDEYRVRQESLYRLVLGLVRRCRQEIYLGISELGEQGYEQRGPLLQTIQSALRRTGEWRTANGEE
jgi:hypothetical protein